MTTDQHAERLEQAIGGARELLRALNSVGKDLRRDAVEVLEELDAQELDQIRTAALELAALIEELELHRVVGATARLTPRKGHSR